MRPKRDRIVSVWMCQQADRTLLSDFGFSRELVAMSTLNVRNITKVFPGTKALDSVSLSFESGKVNALIGKNGSGKSTLVKIINGAYTPDGGTLEIDGQQMQFDNPSDAFSHGIATVYQEMSLIPGLSVAENILIGRYETKGPFVDWKKTYAKAQALLDEMGIDLPVKELVVNLSMWQCQVVEIAKAMSCRPKVILLDEPTSALAQHEIRILFNLIRELKKKDVIVIYITHRLQELWEIADTSTVLRDGLCTGHVEMAHAKHKDILDLMFGDVEVRKRPADLVVSDETIMEVRSFSRAPWFDDISFSLKKGEVLGIAGMLGSGRTELLRAVFGADHADTGEVILDGKRITRPVPREMRTLGLAFTPEDRKSQGLIQILSVKENSCHACLDDISPHGFMDRRLEREYAQRQIDALQIKTAGMDIPMTSLSGGNQQKVVVGKWLNTDPKVIMLDEPSRGIDVNAKQQIFQIIWDQSRRGISSIVVSSELEELLEVCHRIIIMRFGKFIQEVRPEDVSIEQLYSLCMGGE
jgi:ribose transport system ATP-binding protein